MLLATQVVVVPHLMYIFPHDAVFVVPTIVRYLILLIFSIKPVDTSLDERTTGILSKGPLPEFIAQGTPELDRMQDLARFKARERPAGIRSVFLSHGLAGTEVAVAYRALERAGRLGIGQLLGR